MRWDSVPSWPVIGTVLTVLWLFVRDVPLSIGNLFGELLIGAGIGMSVAYVLRRMYVPHVNIARMTTVAPYAAAYVGSFLMEMVYANIAVMKLVLSPRMPIQPDVVKVPLRVESDAAITLIANSITLTPGTLTMDYDPVENALHVHAISGKDRDAVLDPIRRWEDLAMVIFDEEKHLFETMKEEAQKKEPKNVEVNY